MHEVAEVTMALYSGLYLREEVKLKTIEADVINLMLEHGDSRRPFWVSRANTEGRFLQLQVKGAQNPETLLELPEEELENLSGTDLLLRLRKNMAKSEKN